MNVHVYNKSLGGYGGQKSSTKEETRRKQSETHKIRQASPELRRRTSEKMKNRVRTSEHCASISRVKQKPVEQLDKHGNVLAGFSSGIEAENSTGVSRSKICMCCKGQRPRAGGYCWRYKI